MLLGSLLWIASQSRKALAAPVLVRAEDEAVLAWKQEPEGRGTWGIFSSCTITMTLCVYTALHLNIPTLFKESAQLPWWTWQRIKASHRILQFQWILLGLFAPEVVVYAAWTQFRDARWLTNSMKKLLHEVSNIEHRPDRLVLQC